MILIIKFLFVKFILKHQIKGNVAHFFSYIENLSVSNSRKLKIMVHEKAGIQLSQSVKNKLEQ